jgi:prophage regulatory protein
MAIWRIATCKSEAGYSSNSTIYSLIRDGLWTRSIRLGERSVGWPDNEVRTICAARIAGLGDPEIRKLVNQLHEERLNAVALARSST